MDLDAIQQDATQTPMPDAIATATPPADPPADVERPLSPREQAMADIAAKRSAELARESGFEASDVDAQISAQVQPSPTVIAEGFDQVRVRAKIDGEEQDVPLSQVLAQYQKHSTADRRLAEATRLLRDAEARAAAVSISQAPAPAPAADPTPAPAPGTQTKDFLDALFQGDEEKAAQALDSLVAGRQPQAAPIPDAQTLAAQVKQQLAVESALDGFARDYADVCSDPVLANLADAQLARHLAEGLPFTHALEQAGQDVRGWVASKTGAAPVGTPTAPRAEKLERKAALDTLRPAHMVAAHPGAAAPRTEEQIRADALAALIRSRPGMAGGA